MRLGESKSAGDKVLTKRQVAGLLYGAWQMKRDPDHPVPWAFDAFLLMYLLGLRIGELVLLRYSHVGLRDTSGAIRSVKVPTEKKLRATGRFVVEADGEKRPVMERINPLDALNEVPVLAHHDWVARSFDPRTRFGARSISPWILPSPRNADRHITDRSVDYAFREARGRAGLPDVYSTHALRHTAATEIARAVSRRGGGEGEMLAWVGKFLRHSDRIDMGGHRVTRTYIHLAPRGISDWASMAADGVLTLPTPLAPCGVSRFDPARRYG